MNDHDLAGTASGGPILATDEVRVFLWTEPLRVCDPDDDLRPGTILVEVERWDPIAGWGITDQFAAPWWDRELVASMLGEAMECAR